MSWSSGHLTCHIGDVLFRRASHPSNEAEVDALGQEVKTYCCGLQGVAMQRMMRLMIQREGPEAVKFDFALVGGHFLGRDENIFTYFQGHNINVGSSDSSKTDFPSSPHLRSYLLPSP
jgi:hypothetical protein